MTARFADERGASIVTALMVALVVFALGSLWTGVGVHQTSISAHQRKDEQALHAAEAGVNAAISALAGNLHYAGTTGAVPLADGTGEYEVTVAPVDPTNPNDPDRYIVAKGYAPSKASTNRVARQLEQQVLLEPGDGFDFALFASPGGIAGNNYTTVTGDVYSRDAITIAQNSHIRGDVITRGGVTTGNNVDVLGYVHALGNVHLDNTQTVVQGSVFAGGNVSGTGSVNEDVQAGGSFTLSGTVAGTVSSPSNPPEPPDLGQPTFTWDASNYALPFTYGDASHFETYWSEHRTEMDGAHKVNDTDPITLDQTWTMETDVTIVTDGPITLSRQISKATGIADDLVLTIVSTADADPAINLTNLVDVDSGIKVVLFAPNGSIDFLQKKSFHGVAYGETVNLANNMAFTYGPVSPPGFSWDTSSATHFFVKLRTFREVPFTP